MRSKPSTWRYTLIVPLAAGLSAAAGAALAATPATVLANYRAAAGNAAASADRGQQLFTTTHGREWSCASCHGTLPTRAGQHAGTGKPIAPLAPAVNPQRFTDAGKTEKWFRRNCNDVMGRECSAAEKADVLTWLLSLNP
jgi:mono/diheme cytochrome c family protein